MEYADKFCNKALQVILTGVSEAPLEVGIPNNTLKQPRNECKAGNVFPGKGKSMRIQLYIQWSVLAHVHRRQ